MTRRPRLLGSHVASHCNKEAEARPGEPRGHDLEARTGEGVQGRASVPGRGPARVWSSSRHEADPRPLRAGAERAGRVRHAACGLPPAPASPDRGFLLPQEWALAAGHRAGGRGRREQPGAWDGGSWIGTPIFSPVSSADKPEAWPGLSGLSPQEAAVASSPTGFPHLPHAGIAPQEIACTQILGLGFALETQTQTATAGRSPSQAHWPSTFYLIPRGVSPALCSGLGEGLEGEAGSSPQGQPRPQACTRSAWYG